jgi:hypothetical protein
MRTNPPTAQPITIPLFIKASIWLNIKGEHSPPYQ